MLSAESVKASTLAVVMLETKFVHSMGSTLFDREGAEDTDYRLAIRWTV